MRPLLLSSTVFLLLFGKALPAAAEKDALKILYFLSPTCNHCAEVAPFVKKELSVEFEMEGRAAKPEAVKGYPFPVKAASPELKKQYGVKGVPTMIVLKNGQFKTRISGAKDIPISRPLLRALKNGAWTVSEVYEKNPDREILLTGWVRSVGRSLGSDFKLFITDRSKNLIVNPWLPREAVKSKFAQKQQPRVQSEVVGKAVALKGTATRHADGTMRFQVKEEVRFD